MPSTLNETIAHGTESSRVEYVVQRLYQPRLNDPAKHWADVGPGCRSFESAQTHLQLNQNSAGDKRFTHGYRIVERIVTISDRVL